MAVMPSPPRLHLLRHAKSSWEDPELDDFDRPLAPRGRRAAQAMRKHLVEAGVRPSLVLCSPARRTRQTLKQVLGALGDPAVRFEASLYEASVHDVVRLLLRIPVEAREVLVVGHNPWIEELALRLARRPPHAGIDAGGGVDAGDPGDTDAAHDPAAEAAAWERLRRKYPTGALATLRLGRGGWRGLTPGSAHLEAFVGPRDP